MRLRFRRKRAELLAATEKNLAVIAKAVGRAGKPLRGADQIGLRVGKVIGRYKMAKHSRIEISEASFGYERNIAAIAVEAALDGFYVVRSSLPLGTLEPAQLVGAYKGSRRPNGPSAASRRWTCTCVRFTTICPTAFARIPMYIGTGVLRGVAHAAGVGADPVGRR